MSEYGCYEKLTRERCFVLPTPASLDEVRIHRDGDTAVIEHADPTIATTNFTVGPTVREMTDQQILDCFNETMVAHDAGMAAYRHVAVEIPPGRPQVEYHNLSDQWVPRGGVVCCVISDGGPNNEPIIYVDDLKMSWR